MSQCGPPRSRQRAQRSIHWITIPSRAESVRRTTAPVAAKTSAEHTSAAGGRIDKSATWLSGHPAADGLRLGGGSCEPPRRTVRVPDSEGDAGLYVRRTGTWSSAPFSAPRRVTNVAEHHN